MHFDDLIEPQIKRLQFLQRAIQINPNIAGYHEKLGTVADKVERVAKLARWLVEEGLVKGANADDAAQQLSSQGFRASVQAIE